MHLVDFWKKLRKGSTLIHPLDLTEASALFEETYPDLQKVNKTHFVKQLTSWGVPDATAIHHILVPQPYCGSIEPKKGKVYFLMLNPGFNAFDYCELDNRLFRVAVWKNLRQRKMKYPFFFMNPKFWWHPGYQYWNKRLGWLIEAVGRDKLAESLTSIELFAYHSKTYPAKQHKTIKRLPSTQALLTFVKDELVPKAIKGEIILVVVRGRKDFGGLLPTTCNNIIYSPSARSSYIGKESPVGKRLLDFLT